MLFRSVRVGEVEAGGAADLAGLRVGDILVALDGAVVAGADDLLRLLNADRIGRPVDVSLLRGGRIVTKTVTPQERVQPASARR